MSNLNLSFIVDCSKLNWSGSICGNFNALMLYFKQIWRDACEARTLLNFTNFSIQIYSFKSTRQSKKIWEHKFMFWYHRKPVSQCGIIIHTCIYLKHGKYIDACKLVVHGATQTCNILFCALHMQLLNMWHEERWDLWSGFRVKKKMLSALSIMNTRHNITSAKA